MKRFGAPFVAVLIRILSSCAVISSGERINYSGYEIVRVYPETTEQWQQLGSFEKLGVVSLSLDRKHVDFLLAPHLSTFTESMRKHGFKVELLADDVEKVIQSHKVNDKKLVNGSLEWDRNYRLADIYEFLDAQAATHNSIASIQSIGATYEGRDMKIIKISKSGETKPAVWIDSQIHAREWITGAVCTFVIDQLLNSNDTEINSWLDNYDFYILPVFNPDGFEFSHTTDRWWRKSRSDNGSPCLGTDLNRNFDYHWMENGGALPDPCDNGYGGTAPFSDVETRNVRGFLTSISSRLVFFLSLHSHGQFILFPTGLNAERIPQYNTYMRILNMTVDAHKQKFGTIFKPGSVYDELCASLLFVYVATGSSMDWVKDTLKTTLTLGYELRDRGQYGHLLPPDQIYPSGLEFMDGFKVLMSELSKGIPEVDPPMTIV